MSIRRRLLSLGAILAVAIGGVGLYAVFKPVTAESTVRRYFAALADGDTDAALELVDRTGQPSACGMVVGETDEIPTSCPVPDQPLLVRKALSDEHSRPSDLRILHTDSTVAPSGETVDIVRVSYKVGNESVPQSIVVTKPADGSPYRLKEPYLRLISDSLAGRDLTVNGIAVDTEDNGVDSDHADDLFVFPGAYTASAEGGDLLTTATQTAVVQSGTSGRPVVSIDFGTPTLVPVAKELIRGWIRRELGLCARNTSSAPSDCPFSVAISGSGVSVKWSITAYPTVSVALASDPSAGHQVDISSGASQGVAHYVATYTDGLTGEPRTETGDRSFGVRGTASEVSGAGLTISIS